ncbi:UDP-N-acetylmuramate dehydrogenase [Erwinia psidii]|uniref:UDP-N-acetylenolpyruvoylglucosamine reductase n=1 Tax=Erwinia psidii TaxID=69224 RepID=A0A3N6SJC5_9GAMM|nr:UDP-N-acetylmuramate dehydrogenase [Erwinia psidii]MCX8959456.1 UDP-N-acetylmuramate dehydrogenase [Erwinia psidii]RQM37706.1 UDP-N-acetylmuramate dehydrogenase [Erwinia psidii]
MSSQPHSLKLFNTFSLDAMAEQIVVAETAADLVAAWHSAQQQRQPVLLLGEGSNILFLENFHGLVIVNRLKGIGVEESDSAWHLHVGSGENWHRLVQYSLKNGFSGLENLAMIPGCVGSAPIQNIGAYGVELKSVCEYVDVLELSNGEIQRLPAEKCQFGYRDSIFKHQYQTGYAIVAVGLRLKKQWQPVMSYGELSKLDPGTVTAQQIFDAVCHMRSSKLPDPRVTGNAGSFFKNPVVDGAFAESLRQNYPDAPFYLQSDGSVKLAAGWLIERCDLKGFSVGGAAVHRQQALVLINQGQATSNDIVALAREVRLRVGSKFHVWLEPEVRFIGASGEKDAVGVIA